MSAAHSQNLSVSESAEEPNTALVFSVKLNIALTGILSKEKKALKNKVAFQFNIQVRMKSNSFLIQTRCTV